MKIIPASQRKEMSTALDTIQYHSVLPTNSDSRGYEVNMTIMLEDDYLDNEEMRAPRSVTLVKSHGRHTAYFNHQPFEGEVKTFTGTLESFLCWFRAFPHVICTIGVHSGIWESFCVRETSEVE